MVAVKIAVNGKPTEVETGVSLGALLVKLGYAQKAVAVAVNGDFVPRSARGEKQLAENDEVDIVAPMQGG